MSPTGGTLSTFYLFGTALAAGSLTPLPLVPIAAIGRRFFILCTFISLLSYAAVISWEGIALHPCHWGAVALAIAYNVSVPKTGGKLSTALLWAAVFLANAGLVAEAWTPKAELPGLGAATGAYRAPTAVSSAALLGTSLVAMVLGHWYLVVRGLSFDFLRRSVQAFGVALIFRAGVLAAAVIGQWDRWAGLWSDLGASHFALGYGFFAGARVLFGLLATAFLGWMAFVCVRERSSQSATGILYVVVAFVLIGEILACHLLAASGLLL